MTRAYLRWGVQFGGEHFEGRRPLLGYSSAAQSARERTIPTALWDTRREARQYLRTLKAHENMRTDDWRYYRGARVVRVRVTVELAQRTEDAQ